MPPSWPSPPFLGNNIKVDITPAEDEERVDEETDTTTFDRLNYGGGVPSAENRVRIFRSTTRRIDTLNPCYRPTVKGEVVVCSTGTPSYQLARVPVVAVDAVNVIGSILRFLGGIP